MEEKKYIGESGESGGPGGPGGTTYTGTIEGETVHIPLPNGRATAVSKAQWARWFA